LIEKKRKYPAYEQPDPKLFQKKALVSLTYEQILEIANVFYYINTSLAKLPKFFGVPKLDEAHRALHKAIHDCAVNCCLSLEEAARIEKVGKYD